MKNQLFYFFIFCLFTFVSCNPDSKDKEYFNATKASLLSGNNYYQQKKYDVALKEYLDAEAYSEHTSNDTLKSNVQYAIGKVYEQNDSSFRKALNHYFMAYDYVKDSKYTEKELKLLQAIGGAYLQLHNDSALIYYEKAELLSVKIPDSQFSDLLGFAIAYYQLGNYKKTFEYEHKALNLCKNQDDSLRVRFDIAQTYSEANMLDSARCHFTSLLDELQGKDEFYELIINASLSDVEEKAGNYSKSLDYLKKYSALSSKVQSDNVFYNLKEVQSKYDYQLVVNEKQKIILYALSACLLLALIAIYFYHKSQVNKKLLADAKETVYQLDKMAQNYNEKESSFRTVLLQHFNILKKVALIDGYSNSEEKKQGEKYVKKINSIVYGQDELDWQQLYKTMNDLHSSFFDLLKEKYPQLDENEFRICCLSYAGFTNTEISIIMKLSINTVQMKRTSIRKKIGIKETGGNIEEFLKKDIV